MQKIILFILSFILCFSLIGKAQDISLQELVNRKQFTQVIGYAHKLTTTDSLNYSTMNAIAQAYEGMLKYREALNYYQYCLSMDTTNIDILNALARTATNLGKATEAELYFHKVLENDSTNFYANYQLGRLYYQLGNYDKAIKKYEYLITNDETNTTLLKNVGDCYIKVGDGMSAIAAYFLAYEHNKENVGLASTLVNVLLQVGGDEILNAIAVCDTALHYNPGNRLIRQNKGMALYMNKQYAEADTLYSQLIAEGDSSYLTVKYGGTSKYYAGQYMNAIEPLEIAYEMDTTSADVCLLLGSALGKTYDRKHAYTLFDKAEQNMQPKEYMVNQLYLFRGETYQKDSRYNEAARLYYELWKRTEKINVLSMICNLYNPIDLSKEKDNNIKQRGFFINILYIKEFLKSGEDTKNMFFKRNMLELYLEDMFFRNIKEETMIAPDGKKSKITTDEIRELANQLPEMPEKVKREIENRKN